MTDVTKIPFSTIVGYFVLYIAIHIFIAWQYDKLQKELIKQGIKINDTTNELAKKTRTFKILFKWFPAMYLIFILATLML